MISENDIQALCRTSRDAAARLAVASTASRNRALLASARLLDAARKTLLKANAKDVADAKKNSLAAALVDRLALNDARIDAMIKGLKEVAAQPDPVGRTYDCRKRPNGLHIGKIRVPIGVILIIYESRPNVTLDSASLCLKAGNAVILRGGKESLHSNQALVDLFRKALRAARLPEAAVQFIDTPDHDAIPLLVRQTGLIDLCIPRGGEALIRAVTEHARIPVLKHYKGVCHVYVDKSANPDMAEAIVVNAKTQRPSVCNAAETLLLDARLPKETAARILKALHAKGVALKGCLKTRALYSAVRAAKEEDYFTEYLDLTMSVKVVDGVREAMDHIRKYGSGHTDAIVTENKTVADRFLAGVDSSSVMWNASTRFSDGGIYGLGAEIGISTDKIHSRGPMGADDLTTYKWIVIGNGQVRE
ncbi:MAG: glutamate-5-semialdehyde dehydrogenase [Fibrobacterota bacterium]